MNRKMFRAMKRNPKLQEEVCLIDGRKMSRADAIEYYEACIKCIPKQTASDSIENSRRDYIKQKSTLNSVTMTETLLSKVRSQL